MREFLKKLDCLASIETENKLARLLERIAFVFMILMFVFAPHSIAATQITWLTGMFAWLVRQFIKPRPRLIRTPLDVPLWIFFAWSIITSIFSYDPLTSLDKLRNVALFLIFYYIVNVVKTKRAAFFLASTIIISSMVSVVWTPLERISGRGVEILNIGANSPFSKTILTSGDTILKANDKKVATPEDLLAEIESGDATQIYFYRPDFYLTVEIKRADLLEGTNALEKLGIGDWKRSRNWRSTGFLSHYATFAEVLQLITSLTFGLFIAGLSRKGDGETGRRGDGEKYVGDMKENRSDEANPATKSPHLLFSSSPHLLFSSSPFLAFCVVAMAIALLLTVTRASQIGFLISAFAIVFFGANRRILLILMLIILPLTLGGIYFQQQSRKVGYLDLNDDSTKDRLTFYRKGFNLWTQNVRNFSIGVGMDATKRYIKEWDLYDNQGVPMGHFHSTPLQL
ncbi:MAG: PDZ domain-containing protein, partial [Pyrinomonadaceae bacterium]|nr:PDZ domain-containing protein [Pyrinomonadaceae bacterium]